MQEQKLKHRDSGLSRYAEVPLALAIVAETGNQTGSRGIERGVRMLLLHFFYYALFYSPFFLFGFFLLISIRSEKKLLKNLLGKRKKNNPVKSVICS